MSAAWMLLCLSSHAQDGSNQPPAVERPSVLLGLDGVSQWLRSRFTESELRALRREDLGLESHYCGCDDLPHPHFPYVLMMLSTPKGDLLARLERHELGARVTPLAVRDGDMYCPMDTQEACYGAFAHPCDFTDFRYGPGLSQFFPSCKAQPNEADGQQLR
ncbi:MAG TPA: hypothetical protein VFB54_16615 [Burkholderiales bacterium]|nr:hypothetical protein [Burkholderiales bacterium]